jgi:hypothetical protein
MAVKQSWTTDQVFLESQLRLAAIDAKTSIEDKILNKTGRTITEAFMLNDDLDVYIDLQVSPYMAYDNPYRKQMETWDETTDEFAALKAKNYVKPMLPKKTGNLRNNALKVRQNEQGEWEVYIDSIVAPYVQYPNVKRIIDANWPLIRQRFEDNLKGTLGARKGGLYNNRGAVKVIGGGWYDEEGEWKKISPEGAPSKWDYVRYI